MQNSNPQRLLNLNLLRNLGGSYKEDDRQTQTPPHCNISVIVRLFRNKIRTGIAQCCKETREAEKEKGKKKTYTDQKTKQKGENATTLMKP